MTEPDDAMAGFGGEMRAHLERVGSANQTVLADVVQRMLEVIRADGRIHVAGTGHSTALLLETFYRAGGLACVNPLVRPELIPLLGVHASTAAERSDALAHELLDEAAPQAGELGFVFSNSGVNALPVALAQGLRERGATVVAVCSLPHLRAVPPRAEVKLDAVAHHVIDTGVPHGDAAFTVGDSRTAGLSSLTSVYLWNLLLAGLATAADREGLRLPLWTSANTEGGDERNADLIASYHPRVTGM